MVTWWELGPTGASANMQSLCELQVKWFEIRLVCVYDFCGVRTTSVSFYHARKVCCQMAKVGGQQLLHKTCMALLSEAA
jgi:hypothetical protein